MNKAALRKKYLAKQKSISSQERFTKSHRIAELFFVNFDLKKIGFLHCFIPIEKFNEIDTTPIIERIWTDFPNTRTLVPRVNFDTQNLESVSFTKDVDLVVNEWGIREPAREQTLQDDSAVDLVVVPGVAFDRQLHRVGYGKGFYDRFLINCRTDCIKVGLSYFDPESQIVDVGIHDIPLDHIVTPENVYGR